MMNLRNDSLTISLQPRKSSVQYLLLLYFAELLPNMTETRSFDVLINGQPKLPEPITIVRNYSASEVQLQLNFTESTTILTKASNSSSGPILNAMEYYEIVDTHPATYREDSKCPYL